MLRRGIRTVGVIVALTATWLLAQRDDTGAVLALAALGGLGVVLATLEVRSRFVSSAAASVLLLATAAVVVVIGGSTPTAAWFGGGTTHGAVGDRRIALTFDDGPNATTTLLVAHELQAAGVRGTFFEVGRAVDARPDITRALVAAGHLVANHSYAHDQWRWLDPRYPELERAQRAFVRAGVPCPALYRPPHGQRTPFLARVVSSHHMHMVLWDVSASDWTTTNAHLVAQRVLRKVHGGSIVLLHDGLDGHPTVDRTVVARALPEILAGLRARGLQPVRLDVLLRVTPYLPC
jgi:peptidoglycan/xylan/chitin deacetylase (PgdA/CDA1 family)